MGKRLPLFVVFWLLWFACLPIIHAQIYETNNVVVQTFAGSGFSGYVDGVGQQTMFNCPSTIVVDASSNLFVLDTYNYCIRKITPDGAVSTFVGGGKEGLPGYGTNVSLRNLLRPMAIDHLNNLWLVENIYSACISLVRVGSDAHATITNLSIDSITGMCVDSANNLYLSSGDRKIYRYKQNGVLEVFAGSGNTGLVDGHGIFTSFTSPSALAVDSADNIYVFDYHYIRRISQSQDVVTIAGNVNGLSSDIDGVGTNSAFYNVASMCADGVGNIYLAYYSHFGADSIRKISASTNITTVAGSFTESGYLDGSGPIARFRGGGQEGICFSGGKVFLADSINHRIRSVCFNPQPQALIGAGLGIWTYSGLSITGIIGRSYRIESSCDMNKWTTRATLLLNSSPYLWIDPNPVMESKFYRVWLLP